ncbi:MAG: TIGR04282 family arsenosugar biosynthesis glycosyltransferase [Synergistaceae bacterium]|nr:TIGR04282 family arsenosugar biosynthesis glycosyltransferase [Synergistaceae bacterium]
MTAENKQAIIIFSRLPIGSETKTRLASLLNEQQREILHVAMWADIFSEVMNLSGKINIFLYWTGSGDINNYKKFIPENFILRQQTGGNLGEKMNNAMREIFYTGYNRVVLIGSDIPSVRHENIERAFDSLNHSDVVIGPSEDGGYWLIGMKKFISDAFNISRYGDSSVLDSTIMKLNDSGIIYNLVDTLQDLDTPDDIKIFMSQADNQDRKTYKYLEFILKN